LSLKAGSCGDSTAPQLIIENRAVTLDYARDEPGQGYQGSAPRGGMDGRSTAPRASTIKTDWLCDSVRFLIKHYLQVTFVFSVVAKTSHEEWNATNALFLNQKMQHLYQ
jgi:hypothetical protein